MTYDDSILTKDIPPIKIFISSKENADGIIFSQWIDGDMLSFDINANTAIDVSHCYQIATKNYQRFEF